MTTIKVYEVESIDQKKKKFDNFWEQVPLGQKWLSRQVTELKVFLIPSVLWGYRSSIKSSSLHIMMQRKADRWQESQSLLVYGKISSFSLSWETCHLPRSLLDCAGESLKKQPNILETEFNFSFLVMIIFSPFMIIFSPFISLLSCYRPFQVLCASTWMRSKIQCGMIFPGGEKLSPCCMFTHMLSRVSDISYWRLFYFFVGL